MTDTKRLDFIKKHKMEIRYNGLSDEFFISNHAENSQHFRMARNADLRTAIDEAMKEMRGLNNATTN
ncbi:TPA: hypothetical protein PXA26_001653 [Mannheimia haemolytica]|nr:hypothetical protein [Mannheimia haemolytica]HDL6015893.1 hypothetical protein [Mannheimia haemolytica]HEB5664252.1 hypothetical protein [Mannheimia haemolytica]